MWQPILVGESAERARGVVLDIARGLVASERPHKITDGPLFWAYLAGAFDEPWIAERYDDAVDALTVQAERGFRDCSLYYGAAAAGFTIAHVSEAGTAEAALSAIDRMLAEALAVERWTDHYDLINGLVGIAVYLLERTESPAARTALDRVLAHLATTSEVTAHGTTWHTRPELLPAHQRAHCPDGYYNCGVAHGVPGVVSVLARAAAVPDAKAATRTLALDALRWLDAEATDGRYPSWFVPGEPRIATRTAWCYGDPGVAVATWGARVRLGLDTEPAHALARHCAARTFEECHVDDAGVCHGAAGLGHIFNRCYQASRDEAFAAASRRWFEQTLAMRKTEGIAGFLAWTEKPDGTVGWHQATSLLEGPTGIALALLAAIEPTEPGWDRVLLCDLPVIDSSDR